MQQLNNIEERLLYNAHSLIACVEIGKRLISTFNLTEILELIMVKVSELIKAENWSLLLKNETTGELTFTIVTGIYKDKIKGLTLAAEEGIAGYVATTGESVFLPDVSKEPKFDRRVDTLSGFKTDSIICIPLSSHGKILGVIEIVNIKDIEIFKFKELPFLSIMADFAAIAIENSQYLSRIQKMSITDEYTGLYNARYLHEILENLVEQAQKKGEVVAVAFMDVDNFKHVVDTYGHLLGTRVLKEVGEIISSCLSEQDILIKYGGDEYVILFPNKNKDQVGSILEIILQKIRVTPFLSDEPESVHVTASFGVALYPDDAKSKKDLLIQADNLMFDIKRSTKNGIGLR